MNTIANDWYAEQQAAFRDRLAGQKKRNAARAARHAAYRARLAEWERLTGEGQIAPGDEFRRPEPGDFTDDTDF